VALLVLIFFLGLISLFSILLDRVWQRRTGQRSQAQPVDRAPAGPSPATNGQNETLVAQIKAGWHKRMGWHTPLNTEQPRLRNWLITHLEEQPTVQSWVAGLSDAEFSGLQQGLHTFCTALQIDLAWLGKQQLTKDSVLQAAIQATVLHYVQAQHQAQGVQADLLAFKTYLALEQRPYSYEFQPLIQRLYTQLVSAGLAVPVRPETLLANEKVRIEHMLRAIEAAADTNRPAFYRILNALNNTPPPHAATTPLSPAAPINSEPATATVA
jgi:hypothetical protein